MPNILLAMLLASATPLHAPTAPPADLIATGGKIWAGKGLPPATALAVFEGRVVAVGTDAEVARWRGPKTRVVDLKGRLLVPGFDDAHVHFLEGGHKLLSVDLRPSRDEADMARRIGDAARALPEGEWLLEGRWDHEAWPSKKLPSRATVDPVTPKNPVLVKRYDGHMALANALALKAGGIGRQTPDPPGGTIDRDASGEPTGILRDNAIDLVRAVVPPPSHERNLVAVRRALAEAARYGVTSIHDNSPPAALRAYLDLAGRGELTLRVYLLRHAEFLPDLVRAGVTAGLGDEWIRFGAIKIVADGSMGAGTAAFFAPYSDDPKTSGLLLHTVPELERLALDADRAGFQTAVHAIGDRANALVLDAVEKLVASDGARERRFRIEHAQIVREADVARFKRLGVVASIQPSHAIDDLRWAEKRIGSERLRGGYRIRSFLAAGVPVAFGTDFSVEPLDPRIGLYAAVVRELPEGGPKGGFRPEEKVTLEEALDLYTRGSAWAEFAEKVKGTLEKGKLADFVVFDRDLFELEKSDPRGILTAPIDLTVSGGRVVWERKGE